MIEVNKEMSWDEVRDTYGGQLLFIKVLSYVTVDNMKRPNRAFIYCVIENADDKDEVFIRKNSGIDGNLSLPTPSDRLAKEHPELLVYYN